MRDKDHYLHSETVFVVQCKLRPDDDKWFDCKIYKTVEGVDEALRQRRFNEPGFRYRVMVRLVISYDCCYLEDGFEWDGGAE